jgi:hypothetical protein
MKFRMVCMKIREIAKSESRYPVKPLKGSVGVNGAGVVSCERFGGWLWQGARTAYFQKLRSIGALQ